MIYAVVCMLFVLVFLSFSVAGIHPSRSWMSGSFESVRWNACVQTRPPLLPSSERVLEEWVKTHVNSTTGASEEGQTCDVASHREASPTHYRLSYSSPWSWINTKISLLDHQVSPTSDSIRVSCPVITLMARNYLAEKDSQPLKTYNLLNCNCKSSENV